MLKNFIHAVFFAAIFCVHVSSGIRCYTCKWTDMNDKDTACRDGVIGQMKIETCDNSILTQDCQKFTGKWKGIESVLRGCKSDIEVKRSDDDICGTMKFTWNGQVMYDGVSCACSRELCNIAGKVNVLGHVQLLGLLLIFGLL